MLQELLRPLSGRHGTWHHRTVYIIQMNFSAEVRLDRDTGGIEEAGLVGRARQGDQAAWEILVRHYETHLFRLAYLILHDAAEAEDAAQEAFVRAFLSLETYDEARPLRPWLTRIAVNVARNRRRSVGRYLGHLRRLLEKTPEPVLAVNRTEQAIQQRQQAERLWQAVQRLNQIGQEVIYLRYFLDMPEAEMAETLDVAPGTVKSRLHRALKQLRAVVQQDFPALHAEWETGAVTETER